MNDGKRRSVRVMVIALGVSLFAGRAVAQEIGGDWVLDAGGASFPVSIEQTGDRVVLTIRNTNRGNDVLSGSFQGGRLRVARAADDQDMQRLGSPECWPRVLQRADELRSQSAFQRSIDAALTTADGEQVLRGRYTFQPVLRCNAQGDVVQDPPGSVDIVLRPDFPPFELQFTVRQEGAWVVIDEAMIGGDDIYVEAKFERAPAQDSFEVTLGWEGGDGVAVRVTRTDDPLLYRSAPLRIRGPR